MFLKYIKQFKYNGYNNPNKHFFIIIKQDMFNII